MAVSIEELADLIGPVSSKSHACCITSTLCTFLFEPFVRVVKTGVVCVIYRNAVDRESIRRMWCYLRWRRDA